MAECGILDNEDFAMHQVHRLSVGLRAGAAKDLREALGASLEVESAVGGGVGVYDIENVESDHRASAARRPAIVVGVEERSA